MASAARLMRLTTTPQRAGFHTMVVRRAGPLPWNYLWKPGPYPDTEEKRVAAARKYGLIPEDYEPYDPSEGKSCGDYPKLPLVAEAMRDPHYGWDMPELRRDFNEPLHYDWDMYREQRFTPAEKFSNYSLGEMWMASIAIFSILIGLVWFTEDGNNGGWIPTKKQPRMQIQLYEPGVTHYSFEPLD